MKKQEKRPIFSLRVRLVLLVAVELVRSILVALWITRVIQRYFPNDLDIPPILYLILASLFVGVVVTALLSRLFFEPIKIRDRVENVFISFGGADPQNYADRLLEIIRKDEYKPYHFTVALGRAKNNVEELLKYNEYENIDVYYDVPNMPSLMSGCDIAVSSCGRTSFELAMLGIPTIAVSQNAREEKHSFVNNNNGFSYLGTNPANEIIEGTLKIYLQMSKELRQNYQKTLLSHDLRGGRKRVMSLINGL